MYRLIYTSQARPDFSEDDLHDILSEARRNNIRRGITGVLLFDGTTFLQVLEGPEDFVLALADTINRDPRSAPISRLYSGQASERVLTSWSMAYLSLEQADSDHLISRLASNISEAPDRVPDLLDAITRELRNNENSENTIPAVVAAIAEHGQGVPA
ncbi:MAG: BLUF domain-containing protein [Magnetovibrionaceae bacterium]